MAHDDRPNNREVENEDLRSSGEGKPPRPASEPRGSESQQSKTMTDPATGAPNTGRPGGGAGGTYAEGDHAEGARRSKFRTDQRSPK